MLIKIDSSVVNNKDQSIWAKETVEALEILAIARYEGKHSLIGDKDTLKTISKCTRLSERARHVYHKLLQNFTKFKSYQSFVTRYIEIVDDCPEPNLDLITYPGKKIIKVTPRFFNDSALVQPTILLCENADDATLYKKIAKVYAIWKKINISVECDCRGGGGNTITDQFIKIQKEKKHICLCIVDSDRIAFNGSIGNTAKRINSRHDASCIITELFILDLHEIENLIPNSILSNLCSGDIDRQKSLSILEAIQKSTAKDLRGFLDIKNGILMNKIVDASNPVDKEFWKERLSKIPDITNRIDPWCHSNWSCNVSKKCKCQISLGFGEKILEQVLDYVEKKSNHEIAKIVDEDMRLEWDKVGQLILDWCFAETPIRT